MRIAIVTLDGFIEIGSFVAVICRVAAGALGVLGVRLAIDARRAPVPTLLVPATHVRTVWSINDSKPRRTINVTGLRGWAEDRPQLAAGPDAELGKHLPEVPLDRARAQKELRRRRLRAASAQAASSSQSPLAPPAASGGRREARCGGSRHWPLPAIRAT